MKKFTLTICFVIIAFHVFSQESKEKKLTDYKGFFNFSYDESEDKIYLEVTKLNEEFLYVNALATGVGSNDIGLDRGQLGNERVVKFSKAGNKLLLIQTNLNYRAITNNELETKSVQQAFAQSVLYGFIIKEEKDGRFKIDLTPFVMQDAHGVASKLKALKEGDYKIDLTKSAISLDRTKAFPKNVEFESLLTFIGTPTGKNLRGVVPTPSSISVIQHHSFIELPDNKYKPRVFDVRSGAIPMSYFDYASPIQEQINKRFIIRHRLEKKDPEASVSEAVEPIIYYLDSGTPEPIRSALLEGASWWDQAFTAIGFKEAFQVKMLPDDADPLDCRYNVIQWVHRSTRGWSYGASVVDPRTGEIIKGHVSLGSLRVRQDFLIAQALLNKPFAERDDNYQPMLNMALARIRQLGAHEVGHTLGFTHNFAASTNNNASVMDYPHPQIELKNGEVILDNAYSVGIGEWDKVAVAYSYGHFKENENEQNALNSILKNATQKGLRFISDSDARALGGAHSLAHLWDNGKNASKQLEAILNVRQKVISNFSEDNIRNFEPFSVLEDVFVPLYFLHRYQTEAATKIIAGLDYNYAVKGEQNFVVKVIESDIQREALNTVLKTLTAETLAIPKDKLSLFPPRAFGYNRTRESFKGLTGVSFDPLSAASTASDLTLKLLLHPERMNRLIQQKSLDIEQIGIKEVFNELINNTFKTNYNDAYLEEVQQMVNVEVLQHLMNLAVSDKAFFQVKSEANDAINLLSKLLYDKKRPVKYASQYSTMISEFRKNPDKFKLKDSPKIPDGSPIGSDICNYNQN
ncbi:zinc-dependent metalloprotease [Litoribaculum gwangyangense]|uniref:Zinc-dependent metalloprotease n=1 Tax=Litoribaculum gwangyangense TaxID=1130722 RepID=A0ABP9CGX2_9FLAO